VIKGTPENLGIEKGGSIMAVTKIPMPQLGESVTEGTIGKWLKKPGDQINKYDLLCEVITDKVNAEVPSSAGGVLGDILVAEGMTVEVGEIICTIVGEFKPAETAKPTDAEMPRQSSKQQASVQVERGAKERYSPAVLRLSQEHGIDLKRIQGTGLDGRITRKDVLKAIEQGVPGIAKTPTVEESIPDDATKPAASEPSKSAQPSAPAIYTESCDQVIETTAVRRTIANRMLQSKHEIPHAWTMVEVDVTELVKLRDREKDAFFRREGIKLTYLPFFIKAVVVALKEHPILNSVWEEDRIVIKKGIHLSMAVATEDSLFTPVIRNADQKSITGIAADIEDLANRARNGKLKLEDMQGGTFTVNNTGSFGSIQSMPIINYPQAAILTMESIVKRPVVINDMIAVRSMVNLCLSLDHRTLDGLVCGRFLGKVKQNLEGMDSAAKLY
jgi:2-oxoisovalerate dehydrogenase E2 component (dihydrolipoyl transacylase)